MTSCPEPTPPVIRTAAPAPADLQTLARTTARLRQNIERVIEGKGEVVRSAIVVLLAEGHLLLEDVPGVGKTMLSKALARSIDCSVRRIQFTPDLLPSDVTGVSVFNQQTREFEFRPGGVFANVVIGDEINRASPKTQSALLECMEERQVTVDGTSYELDSPFLVIATQNPVEMEGTYALPEAQRDRFMMRVSMGYPVEAAEVQMLAHHAGRDPLGDLEPVTDATEIRKLVSIVAQTYVAEQVQHYAVAIVRATRTTPELALGASPRATLHLVRAAKAMAAMNGREFVVPDDVLALAVPVLAHRVVVRPDALGGQRAAADVVAQLAASVPVPGKQPTR
ncbi:MAG TPA: MoxR family ATPase [Nocardioides sp.]